MRSIKEWQGVDRQVFESEILPANQPAVLKGLLRDWPAVKAGKESTASIVEYIKGMDVGGSVNAYVGTPDIKGRFFYSDDFRGFNFNSQDVSISVAMDTLASVADQEEQPAIALQAIEIPAIMQAFLGDNSMPLLDDRIEPRIWINNRTMIATHFDVNHNIAGVVSGRREFTVFPPEQASNLYIGPLLNTPGGPPISTVNLRDPDLETFPRFAQALESAQRATLEPGAAIFIPILWWHGVDSLGPLNILVNYWWNDTPTARFDPMLSMIQCMALMSGLPDEQRDAWRAMFECFVFQEDGPPGAHLPPDLRDVMGNLSDADRNMLLANIAERMRG